MGDSFRALGAGLVNVTVATPASFAPLALKGLSPFSGHPIEELRAIAILPHRDAMIAVARADLGFRTLADAASHDEPLRISLGAGMPMDSWDSARGCAAWPRSRTRPASSTSAHQPRVGRRDRRRAGCPGGNGDGLRDGLRDRAGADRVRAAPAAPGPGQTPRPAPAPAWPGADPRGPGDIFCCSTSAKARTANFEAQ